MAPLTAPTDRPNTGREMEYQFPLKAGTNALRHAMLLQDANALGVDPGALAGETFAGVVLHGFDNTTGTNGFVKRTQADVAQAERYCVLARDGEWDFAVSGTTPKRDQNAYWVDNNTVSTDSTGGRPLVGKFTMEGDLGWFVDISRAF